VAYFHFTHSHWPTIRLTTLEHALLLILRPLRFPLQNVTILGMTETIVVGLHGHDVPTWWHADVLLGRELPRHLEKEKENKSK
jgi:hypothetical protein